MSLGIDSPLVIIGLEILAVLLHVTVIAAVLLARRREPSATLAWILFIVVAPFLGAGLYLLLGRTRMRRAARRSNRAEARLRALLSRYDVRGRLERGTGVVDARTRAMIRLGGALASTPASLGNATQALVDAATTYREIADAIRQAQHHIHVEFYIIQPDAVGTGLRDLLAERAAAGIEVRVLCDGIGSMSLPADFWAPLRAAGGRAATFAPLSKLIPHFRRRDRFDFRNHRKIVVVDGHIGFTGGINVGKEYLGLDPAIGKWRDTHIRIAGPAVLSLQQTFLQDWLLTTGQAPDDEHYFPACPPAGECLVQVIDSGPDQAWASVELYYAQAIALACERVWITNPYFVPSQLIEAALTVAALRGVDVRILLPKKSDSRLVTWASHSYYAPLLHAGVRIFEYARGFVHAKTMVVDEWVATIGSANMDMRSFKLNFELNAFVFGQRLCRDVARQFALDLEAATEVTGEWEKRMGLGRRLVRGVARLLSPLL
ncbi:MAG: cardiolipin synthase [Deltaproteobacteria bacterium]|jgi:cardiolipin synthase|nr:cardiolipin synthase [Deltaproteobacteria bacterium]